MFFVLVLSLVLVLVAFLLIFACIIVYTILQIFIIESWEWKHKNNYLVIYPFWVTTELNLI